LFLDKKKKINLEQLRNIVTKRAQTPQKRWSKGFCFNLGLPVNSVASNTTASVAKHNFYIILVRAARPFTLSAAAPLYNNYYYRVGDAYVHTCPNLTVGQDKLSY
jgi:hypothetical protein